MDSSVLDIWSTLVEADCLLASSTFGGFDIGGLSIWVSGVD